LRMRCWTSRMSMVCCWGSMNDQKPCSLTYAGMRCRTIKIKASFSAFCSGKQGEASTTNSRSGGTDSSVTVSRFVPMKSNMYLSPGISDS
jgi:hypothetical protein